MSETVDSYWRMARQWQRDEIKPHSVVCPCLPCADLRDLMGRPLTPDLPRPAEKRMAS